MSRYDVLLGGFIVASWVYTGIGGLLPTYMGVEDLTSYWVGGFLGFLAASSYVWGQSKEAVSRLAYFFYIVTAFSSAASIFLALIYLDAMLLLSSIFLGSGAFFLLLGLLKKPRPAPTGLNN